MIASGAFTEDDRLELIDGWLVQKTSKGPAHEFNTGQLAALLEDRIPSTVHVRNQAPITRQGSEPEPDLTIVRGSRSDYRDHHPGARDALLVVEVSDTTLATDRLKGGTYAAAGIAEYWIVNLAERSVEIHRSPLPDGSGYGERATLREGQHVRFAGAHEAAEIAVNDILP